MSEPIFTIKAEKDTEEFGQFIIETLEQGFGHTLGNAFRRVILVSVPGAAATQVKINKVKHRFSTLEGLKEDIIEFILNVKKIRLTYDGDKPEKITLQKNNNTNSQQTAGTKWKTVFNLRPETIKGARSCNS